MAEPTGFPVTVKDDCGDGIEIGVSNGHVHINFTDGVYVSLGPAEREAFAQAWIAACHEADRQASPKLCGELAPGAVAIDCTETGAHEEHIARIPGGVIAARWPVGDPGPAPRGTGLRCQTVHPTADQKWLCTADPGHAPLDHAAYGIDGELFARWPVGDG